MAAREVVILGAARTPIGRYGGSLKDIHPAELGAVAARAAIERAERPRRRDRRSDHRARPPGRVGPESRAAGRVTAPAFLSASPAQTINKACASGLQAIAAAAQSILLGESDCVLAGGIESMSRMPYLIDSADARWGHRMGNFPLVDAMYRDGFQDPLSGLIMGETAEVLARQYGITREASDQFALESQQKAEAAQKAGYFTREIAPVTLDGEGQVAAVVRHRRASASRDDARGAGEAAAGLSRGRRTRRASSPLDRRPASPMAAPRSCWPRTDGPRTADSTPLARITGWASAGVDPRLMGIGPVPAIAEAATSAPGSTCRASISSSSTKRSPRRCSRCSRTSPIPREKLNVNGGAIALGHPIGCTGARMVVTLLHEMQRRGVSAGLATLCVSGGMGMAMAIERL